MGLAGLFASLAACGDDSPSSHGGAGGKTGTTVTSGGAGGAGGAAGCGPALGQPVTDGCRACAAQHCCAEGQACAADTTCSELTACYEGCDWDAGCIQQTCAPLMPAGFNSVAVELELCELEQCQVECNIAYPCEQLEGAQPPSCGDCLFTQCCDAATALYSPDWLRFQLCQNECLDYACLADCDATYPTVVDALRAVNECVLGPTCGDACSQPNTCGGIGFGDASCGVCATSEPSCCDLFAACSTDPLCIDFFNCSNACSNAAECAECASLFGVAPSSLKVAAENCLADKCSVCGLGVTCGQSHRMASAECATCIEQSCCALGTACGLDPACTALEMCTILCAGDAACASGCEAQFPAGATAYADFAACVSASCSATCP